MSGRAQVPVRSPLLAAYPIPSTILMERSAVHCEYDARKVYLPIVVVDPEG